MAACEHCCSFGHAIIHEFIPASQFNFLCPSLLFAARPFFATFFFREPDFSAPLSTKGAGEKTEGGVCANALPSNKDNGNG